MDRSGIAISARYGAMTEMHIPKNVQPCELRGFKERESFPATKLFLTYLAGIFSVG
jgi:hypothetical protein